MKVKFTSLEKKVINGKINTGLEILNSLCKKYDWLVDEYSYQCADKYKLDKFTDEEIIKYSTCILKRTNPTEWFVGNTTTLSESFYSRYILFTYLKSKPKVIKYNSFIVTHEFDDKASVKDVIRTIINIAFHNIIKNEVLIGHQSLSSELTEQETRKAVIMLMRIDSIVNIVRGFIKTCLDRCVMYRK